MTHHRIVVIGMIAGLLTTPGATAAGAEPDPPRVDFSRDIRPIFSDNCFTCHGPDAKKRKAGLRLDTRQGAFADLDGHHALVAGDVSASALYARITAEEAGDRMPPLSSGKSLTAEQIALIRQWIEQGADWQEHWSFVPPKRPPLPTVKGADWPRNAIDYFILSRIERDGLTPSPQADPRTLIRRVSFDLTGLPPTPAEIEAFVRDSSSSAYERLVDRLLDSPHYGEHMARFWLDAARYGDTHGLHLDNYREMWLYRDWVINAFNANLSYDAFTIQQLAGDLLPDATLDEQIATGFNRCHVSTNEGGSIDEEVYVRNVVDRVETTGTVFLGLTVGCAVCHDHKFDPINQKEFYQLFAFFNSLDGPAMDGNRKDPAPVVKVASPEVQSELTALGTAIRRIEARMNQPLPEIDADQAAWETELRARLPAEKGEGQGSEFEPAATPATLGTWHTLGPFKASSAQEAFRTIFPPERGTDLTRTYDEGKLVWTAQPKIEDGKSRPVEGRYAATYLLRRIDAPTAREMTIALDGNGLVSAWLNGTWLLSKEGKKRRSMTLWLEAGENLLLVKVCNSRYRSNFRFDKVSEQSGLVPPKVAKALEVAREKRTDADRATLRRYYRRGHWPEWEALSAEHRVQRRKQERLEIAVPTTLVFKERAEPRDAFLLRRGQYDLRQEKVGRATPAVLPAMADTLPRNRLGLARWLIDGSHPLTARVAVNRFWLQCFGTGIVKTAEDFGAQGEPPSHPELLDYLATQFVTDGWDVKKLMKQIVMSAAYRQSAQVDPALLAHDPENRLLARGPRFRLDAEMLRDQAFFIAGLLSPKIGGPSVKPPQPDGLWFAVGYSGSNTVRFKPDRGEKVFRRSVYTFWKRTAPPPTMRSFDAPSREACRVRRERTNTPLQALLLMNEQQYVEAARHLACRALLEGGSTVDARITFAFQLATGRAPDPSELADLAAVLNDNVAHFEQDRDAANKLIQVGESAPDATLDAVELAAWTMVANLILNLDEVLTKG